MILMTSSMFVQRDDETLEDVSPLLGFLRSSYCVLRVITSFWCSM